ncbi:MAG TPA: membrane protein insertase YidC [Terracidiphilus sp.]|nr:membrane protein insertase YidC [Terracidiphilus sp.]
MPEIHNPNLQTQGPGGGGSSGGDMRSTIAFTVLILVVLLGYQYLFKPTPPPTSAPQTQSQAAQPAAQTGQPASQPSASAQAQLPGASAQAATATPTVAAAIVTDTTVENELYKIVFTNRGARVKQWILKKYIDTAGKPLDMVQPQASERFGYPLSLYTYEPALTSQVNDSLYQVTVEGAQPSATGEVLAPNTITYHYSANGLDVVKSFSFDSSYVVTVSTSVKRNGVPVRALVEWPAGLGDMEEFLPSSLTRSQVRTSASSQFAWSIDGKQDSMAAKKVSGNATLDQPYNYAAVMDLYFAAAFLPDNPERASVVTLHNSVDLPGNLSDPNSQKSPADVIGLAVGDTSGSTHLRVFAGPKATDTLASIHAIGPDGKATGQSLEPLIQFGWWTFIAKPLYLVLRFMVLHGIGNWGWAIIIFTVIFSLVLLPTRFMMMKSSLKMMRIQPKVEAIKKRYAHLKVNDPKRSEMNTEMMALYKTEGVNMYGGCLPLLLQMPLFFAYFRVLQNAVELRQAHWYWLTDLSNPDPLHILPILIILTMFLTQYITPSPGMDPAQRRMMAFMMPIFFGFMLWHYASGLALYWGTSNIINLAIQVSINQSHIGKEMHEIASKRAAKKAGINPKTIQGRK